MRSHLGDLSFEIYINDLDQSDYIFHGVEDGFTNVVCVLIVDQTLWLNNTN